MPESNVLVKVTQSKSRNYTILSRMALEGKAEDVRLYAASLEINFSESEITLNDTLFLPRYRGGLINKYFVSIDDMCQYLDVVSVDAFKKSMIPATARTNFEVLQVQTIGGDVDLKNGPFDIIYFEIEYGILLPLIILEVPEGVPGRTYNFEITNVDKMVIPRDTKEGG